MRCLSVFTRLFKGPAEIEATFSFSEVPFLYKPFAKQAVALRTGQALNTESTENRAAHPGRTSLRDRLSKEQRSAPRQDSPVTVTQLGEAWHWAPGSAPRFCPLQPPAQRAAQNTEMKRSSRE